MCIYTFFQIRFDILSLPIYSLLFMFVYMYMYAQMYVYMNEPLKCKRKSKVRQKAVNQMRKFPNKIDKNCLAEGTFCVKSCLS